MAPAVPTATSDITYFQTETTHPELSGDVGFAAPLAVANVEANKIRSKVFLESEFAILGIPGLIKGVASGGVKIVSTVKNTSASDVSKAIGNFAKDESGAVGIGAQKEELGVIALMNSPVL